MGKQIRFYILPEDELKFLDFVFQKPGIQLLRRVFETSNPFINKVTLLGEHKLHRVYIWDSDIRFDEMRIEKFFYKKLDESSGLYNDTEEAYYTITNALDAPFIEYTRSFIREDGKLVGGRVWAEMYRTQGNEMVLKVPQFISWFEDISFWLKQNLKRDRDINAYVSQRAVEWRSMGGEFH